MERRKFLYLCGCTTVYTVIKGPQAIVEAAQFNLQLQPETPFLPPGYKLTGQFWEGTASYYSKTGCLGCRADQSMANGEIFDENALTLAFMKAPLNSLVLITNTDNNLTVLAKVTDHGGFEPYGRIADLSLGLRNKIQGKDLTPVKITLLKAERFTPSNRGASWPGLDDEVSGLPWPRSGGYVPW